MSFGLQEVSSHDLRKDYGGLGVVMATFFWIGFSSTIIVWGAALCPAPTQRRNLGAEPPNSLPD
jgi:uncharacterized BrkB/YihY/UPF0761 family membrane protein